MWQRADVFDGNGEVKDLLNGDEKVKKFRTKMLLRLNEKINSYISINFEHCSRIFQFNIKDIQEQLNKEYSIFIAHSIMKLELLIRGRDIADLDKFSELTRDFTRDFEEKSDEVLSDLDKKFKDYFLNTLCKQALDTLIISIKKSCKELIVIAEKAYHDYSKDFNLNFSGIKESCLKIFIDDYEEKIKSLLILCDNEINSRADEMARSLNKNNMVSFFIFFKNSMNTVIEKKHKEFFNELKHSVPKDIESICNDLKQRIEEDERTVKAFLVWYSMKSKENQDDGVVVEALLSLRSRNNPN